MTPYQPGPDEIAQILKDPAAFNAFSEHRLRPYQLEVLRAVSRSVIEGLGLSFVVMFPRQSGKNEVQAQLEAYLLAVYHIAGTDIVKVSPTWLPQSQNAMRRLERVLSGNTFVQKFMGWDREGSYIYRCGQARVYFFSGTPVSNVVGATATHLLECDEAQDVQIAKWDKDFNPMAASRNATRVFWGTAWTSKTLLARELRAAREAERLDGQQRVFVLTAGDVAASVPAYARHVAADIAKLGRHHPFVRTQYYSEEIDAESGMFPAARRALMQGDHPRQERPAHPGRLYALLIDVAGEDRTGALTPALENSACPSPDSGRGALEDLNAVNLTPGLENSALPSPVFGSKASIPGPAWGEGAGAESACSETSQLPSPVLESKASSTGPAGGEGSRDATALTVVEIDLTTLHDDLLQAPTYRVVDRRVWTGVRHTLLFAQIKALAETWAAARVVVDATGVGAGLASFLERALPHRVIPFTFSSASKSQLGWDFLAVVETGRFKDWRPAQPGLPDEQSLFWQQLEACEMEILPGPERRLRWGVPDGTRDISTGALIHDDLVLSAALCAVLDGQSWGVGHAVVLPARDPLAGLGDVF